ESLAIHNVNERIKLIYGEEYGLTIRPVGEEETASTITIPYVYKEVRESKLDLPGINTKSTTKSKQKK
ncbi:MAG TPA: hypothetical protein VN131_00260, partial [Mobilitalea sp.]|nr:hypothetical protein [Mobilitalea sp.]